MITLLDYGAGNVRSVINALKRLGQEVRIVQSPRDIEEAAKLIFPGVGAFGNMMHILERKGFAQPLKAYLQADRPFLGICLGLQALFESSEEASDVPGLGIIPGQVKRFDIELSVPHIGWNSIRVAKPSPLFDGFTGEEKLYFVHSFHVVPDQEEVILARTDYGGEFVSAVQLGNLMATQFHPEKSGPVGLQILNNFVRDDASQAQPAHCPETTRLAKRIVACLDVRSNDHGDLVVTKGDQYDVRESGAVRNMGKPVQLARQYYEQGADEIAFLNITGFRDFPLEDAPMLEVLKQTSTNVFVPLTIGGGIRDYTDSRGHTYSALDVAAEYFRSGADKISIGSDAVLIVEDVLKSGTRTGTSAIESISRVYGNQAVVISVDPRRVYVHSPNETAHRVFPTNSPGPDGELYCWFQCTIKGGREGRELDAVTLAMVCEELGAGEILLNSIDRDGTNAGFDLELISAVSQAVSIPVIASSGAGNVEHFKDVFTRTQAEAALAAGIFHRNEVTIAEVKQGLASFVEVRLG